jgi:hypothetical protein
MHWFCGVDGADGSELGHGAHYCCVDCGNKKNGISSTKHNCKGGMGTVDKRKTSLRKQQPQVVSARKPSSGRNEHGVGKGQGGAQNNLSKCPPVSSDDSNGTSDVSSVDSPLKKRAKKQGISSSVTVKGRGAGNKYQKKDPKTTKASNSSTNGGSAGNKSQKKDPKLTKARSSSTNGRDVGNSQKGVNRKAMKNTNVTNGQKGPSRKRKNNNSSIPPLLQNSGGDPAIDAFSRALLFILIPRLQPCSGR